MKKLLKEMHAHSGDCPECGGIVKMFRDHKGNLTPENCCCFQCGALYYMDIPDLKAWEIEQWRQKARLEEV